MIATPACNDGGDRERVPPASDSKPDFTTRWYQFCISDIVSVLCISIHGMRKFTERFFTEDGMAKKAKKAKKTAKAATKKVAKKTSKKKK